jgi:uncharacterized protein (TIGR03000 family)
MKRFVALAAVGVVALFLALRTPAFAQRVGGIGGIGGFRGIGGFGGLRIGGGLRLPSISLTPFRIGVPGWYSSPRLEGWRRDYSYPYANGYSYSSNPGTSYSAFYAPEQSADVHAVKISMHVPNGARVWFDGATTSQTGPERTFVSPSLTPGSEYVYQIRVKWDENGKAVERSRDVTVHAGDLIHLNFKQ